MRRKPSFGPGIADGLAARRHDLEHEIAARLLQQDASRKTDLPALQNELGAVDQLLERMPKSRFSTLEWSAIAITAAAALLTIGLLVHVPNPEITVDVETTAATIAFGKAADIVASGRIAVQSDTFSASGVIVDGETKPMAPDIAARVDELTELSVMDPATVLAMESDKPGCWSLQVMRGLIEATVQERLADPPGRSPVSVRLPKDGLLRYCGDAPPPIIADDVEELRIFRTFDTGAPPLMLLPSIVTGSLGFGGTDLVRPLAPAPNWR